MRKFSGLFFGSEGASKQVAARTSGTSVLRRGITVLLATVTAALVGLPAQSQTTPAPNYIPGIISSSVSPVPTVVTPAMKLPPAANGGITSLLTPSEVAVDACGNIYAFDHGYDGSAQVIEIPPGGGQPTIAYISSNTYGNHMAQDPLHAHLLVGNPYNTGYNVVPLTNCVAQPSQVTKVGSSGPGALFYYYNPGYATGDFAGNTFISTQGTCCVTGQNWLLEVVDNTGDPILGNQPNEILSMAADQADNLYFITGAAVYELPYSGGKYAATPVPYGSYLNPVGLSVDAAGDLFVADSSAASIYEIPNEGTTGLNPNDQFVVASGININVAVAVNARGDMYFTAAGATAVSELSLGNANFNSVQPGQSATRIINFQFNTVTTLTNIQAPTGDFTIQPAALGTTACKTGTAYGPAGTKSCQITVKFTPTSVGKQSSAVILSYPAAGANSTTVTQTVTAFVEGIGQGPLLTLDPGTLNPTDTGVQAPAGIAVDTAGNTYIADPTANSVTEYPLGGGAPVPVAITDGTTGVTPALSGPLGVSVDGAGDVFIADTGNNRVVEVPFLNGALSAAASTVVASGLNAPAGVFVHTNGDLYVADTGDNTILLYPNFNGTTNNGASFGAATKLGTGLSAPLAVTVDGPGDVFIADSGNNQILEFPLGGGQEIVAADILNPSGLSTDTSGSLFVVDQGNFRVLRIPSVQGTLSPNSAVEVGLGVANPYGVAVDSSSNLYVTDKTNGAAYTIARSQVTLSFGDLAVGTSSDALPLTVESSGNLPLIFDASYFTETGNSGDFAMTSPTGACASGTTLVTGGTCDLSTTFTPTVAGARSATIAFNSNAVNPAQVNLIGTGVTPSPTTTTLALITSIAGAPFYGEAISFTATVAPTSGSGTPTGVVSFIVDGTQVGLLPVVKGVATLQLNSGLTGGTHSVYAVYKGDPSDNGSSSAVLPVTISRAPTTPTLVITKIPYNNPYSLRHSNAGSCSVTDNLGYDATFGALPTDGIGFTASVSSPGVGVPSGTLTFLSDGVPINGMTPPAPAISLDPGAGSFPANQTVYIVLTLSGDFGETMAGASANVTTTDATSGVTVTLAKSYGPAATSVNVYEADVPAGSPAPTVFYKAGSAQLGTTLVVTTTATSANNNSMPPTTSPSGTALLPASGGVFSGSISSDANTLGDGTILGQNNVLLGPHNITVVYSGDQNYLPSTSAVTVVTVTDVSPTTPVTLPQTPAKPAPYCDANSAITVSQPSDPGTFTVSPSSTNITAAANAPGTVTMTISSLGGWQGTIEFACPDLPQYVTCSANPGQAALNPSTPGSTALPIQVVMTFTSNVPVYVPTASQSGLFWLTSLLLGFAALAARRFRKAKGGLFLTGLTILLFGGIASLSGCGSNSSTSGSITKPGSYPITVVFNAAQHDPFAYNEVYRADVPFTVPLTLTVK